jgi:dipeptidase D
MSASVRNLEPKEVWTKFADLNEVPRASKKEEKVIAFIKSFGAGLSLETLQDHIGNVLIKKPATKGLESKKTVVLQSHLDMVHQKNNDTIFDFDTQGIQMYVDGDWVKANGTTLGADNGLGVASIMAILASTTIEHPAIEALFTIDEETGMTGALGLEGGWLKGDILLNLDTEEDDSIEIGCAGGIDVTATRKYETIACPSHHIGMKISVNGLQGGHSGMDIHKGFGNANKIMNRILYALCLENGGMISEIDGGSLRNAIPRESNAVISLQVEFKPTFLAAFQKIKEEILAEFISIEKKLSIELVEVTNPTSAMDPVEEIKLLKAINAAPNGVYRMSPQIAGLVEASNNVARVEVKNGAAKILCLARSSVESSKTDVSIAVGSAFELAGYDVKLSGSYPGWSPNANSPILKVLTEKYKALFNSEPHVGACHAGLECGIIGRNYPNLDMISFGPTIKGAHSPDERASISSTQKFWNFLQHILKNIPEKNN